MALHDDSYDPSDSGNIVIMLRYCRGEFAVGHLLKRGIAAMGCFCGVNELPAEDVMDHLL